VPSLSGTSEEVWAEKIGDWNLTIRGENRTSWPAIAKIFNEEAANSGTKIEVHDFFRGSFMLPAMQLP
jgi:hypothetical protein